MRLGFVKFKRTLNYNLVKSKTVLKTHNGLNYFEIINNNYFFMNFMLSDCVLFPETSMK